MKVELRIFSPRWGHEDTYSVELEQDFMEIKMHARKARATWKDLSDPEWSGESILGIMQNDSIYPPSITQDLFEHAWKSWRNREVSDQELNEELQLLAEWLNTITNAKPRSDFWRKYF